MDTDHPITCHRIISEPGDMTRYDYIFIKTSPHHYHFMPYKNTFNYPQIINYWEIEDAEEKTDDPIVQALAKKYKSNPSTVLECIRTIKRIQG
jgi:hypothetical protein